MTVKFQFEISTKHIFKSAPYTTGVQQEVLLPQNMKILNREKKRKKINALVTWQTGKTFKRDEREIEKI